MKDEDGKLFADPRSSLMGMPNNGNTVSEKEENNRGTAGSVSQNDIGTGDPATLYLREMGRASLLTKAEEVILSKQIESQQKVIRETMLEVPLLSLRSDNFAIKPSTKH